MTVEEPTKRRAILIFVLNRPGVLNKISMLIRRKMYNVETITACRTHRPGISRMTLTLYENSDDKMQQVIKQIEKVAEVLSAKELDVDGSFWREVAIIKLEADEAVDRRSRPAIQFSNSRPLQPRTVYRSGRRHVKICRRFYAGGG